jgi:hypothetical protein
MLTFTANDAPMLLLDRAPVETANFGLNASLEHSPTWNLLDRFAV